MGRNRRSALVLKALLLITTILFFCSFAVANNNVLQDIEKNHYVDSTPSLVVQDNYYNRISRNLEEYYFLQLGQEILGEEADPSIIGDESPLAGSSVSINSDGSIVVIGSPGFAFCRGSVYVYQYNNITLVWDQLGDDLWGASQSDFGTSVSISADGRRVAVGSRSALSAKGQIQVFETPYYSSSQIGSTLVGLASDSYFGKSVALNQDGSILAGGAFFYDGGKGYVSIYELIGDEWSQLGASIFGVRLSYFGTSIALNQSGNRIIIGADVDGENSSFLGSAHVYEWSSSNSSWARLGQTLNGSAAYDYFGKNVDMSDDGGRIVVSATGRDNMLPDNELNLGQVFIFDYDNALDRWTEVGSVYGEFSEDQSGEGLSISGDGNRIAIGAAMNDDGGNNAGHVRIFDYHSDLDAWEQTAWDLDDRENESRFGSAVALSGDGNRFAVGAPKKRYELGSAKMYEIRYGIPPTSAPSVSPSPTESPSNIPSAMPTEVPTGNPSDIPSQQPSTRPSAFPTLAPSEHPSTYPSVSPSFEPSFLPSIVPSEIPTIVPSFIPTLSPSDHPSLKPSVPPTSDPSSQPSVVPSFSPSTLPSSVPSVLPTGSPTDEPSMNPSKEPSRTPTVTPSSLPSTMPSMIPSKDPSVSPSTVPTNVPSNIPTNVPSNVPSNKPSLRPSLSPRPTEEYLPSAKPSVSSKPTTRPSGQPSNDPTQRPSERPSDLPSESPTFIPTLSPSDHPSLKPSVLPTSDPSLQPSIVPSFSPSDLPSSTPSVFPTGSPSDEPSMNPSKEPSRTPTVNPTSLPSRMPSTIPSKDPSVSPSTVPTNVPSNTPTNVPSNKPSLRPSLSPRPTEEYLPSAKPSVSSKPSTRPSGQPSNVPTQRPSERPSDLPSESPTFIPTLSPSDHPSLKPSVLPTSDPSLQPSIVPSFSPSTLPSSVPSVLPTGSPSNDPSVSPSTVPTNFPSNTPSNKPSLRPSLSPRPTEEYLPSAKPSVSSKPTTRPSGQPSNDPTQRPSERPSDLPSESPTFIPTLFPTEGPSFEPSLIPSLVSSEIPTKIPSLKPTKLQSFLPSSEPSFLPSSLSSVLPSLKPSVIPTWKSTLQPSSSLKPSPAFFPSTNPSVSLFPSSTPSLHPSTVPTSQPSNIPSLLSSEMPSEEPTQILIVPSNTPSFQPSYLVDTAVTFDIEFSVSCPFDENEISALTSSLELVLSSVISIDDVHTEVTVTIFNGNECFSRRNRRALASFRTIKAEAEVHLSTFDPSIVLPISSDALAMIKNEESFIYDEIFIQSGISIANMTISVIEDPSGAPTDIPTVEPTLEPSAMPSQKPSESLTPSTSTALFSMPSESPSSSKPSQGPTAPVIEIHHVEVTYIVGFKYNPPEPFYNAATLKDLNVYGDVMNTVKLVLFDFLLPSSNHTNVEGYRQMLEIYDTYTINDHMNSVKHKTIIDVLACPIEFDSSDSCVKVVTDIGIEINVIKIEANEVISTLKSVLRNAMKSPDFVQMLNDTDIVQVQYEDNVHIDGKDRLSTSMISIIASSCVVGIVAIIFGIRRYHSYCFHESNFVHCKNNCNIKSADFCADDEKLGPRSTYYERQTAPPMNEVYPSSRPVSAITNITSAVSRISHSVSPIITELKSKKRSLEMRFSSIFGGDNAPQETSTRATNPSVRTRRRSRQRRTPQTDQSSTKT